MRQLIGLLVMALKAAAVAALAYGGYWLYNRTYKPVPVNLVSARPADLYVAMPSVRYDSEQECYEIARKSNEMGDEGSLVVVRPNSAGQHLLITVEMSQSFLGSKNRVSGGEATVNATDFDLTEDGETFAPLLLVTTCASGFLVQNIKESDTMRTVGYTLSGPGGGLQELVAVSASHLTAGVPPMWRHDGTFAVVHADAGKGRKGEMKSLLLEERFSGARGMQVTYRFGGSGDVDEPQTWLLQWDSGSDGYLTSGGKRQAGAYLGFTKVQVSMVFPRSRKRSGDCVMRVFDKTGRIPVPRT